MKELVLTHLLDVTAVVALVDYAAYTASVKILPIDKNSWQLSEVGQLIAEGKLRPYRDMFGNQSSITSRTEAWLAFDPVKGCLAVTSAGEVLCVPAYEYISRIRNYMRHTDVTFYPRYLGDSGRSFYEIVKAVEKKYNATLQSKDVCEEIVNLTGVWIDCEVPGSKVMYNLATTYKLWGYGCHIDRLELTGESDKVSITLRDVVVDELCIDGAEDVQVKNEGPAEIRTMRLSSSVAVLNFYTEASFICPELVAEDDSSLAKLVGYNRPKADLSRFKKLYRLEKCWRYMKNCFDVLLEELRPINVVLACEKPLEVDNCFWNVAIQNLVLCKECEGVLDIARFRHVEFSFVNFSGINFIKGTCLGHIASSFVSNEFSGKFDVTVGAIVASFGSIAVIKNGSYPYDRKVYELKYSPEGVITALLKDTMRTLSGKFSLGSTLSRSRNWVIAPWKQVHSIMYMDGQNIPVLRLYTHDNVKFVVHSFVDECEVCDAGESPEFEKGVHKLVVGRNLYTNVLHYGDKSFYSCQFSPCHIGIIPEGVLTIGSRAFYSASGITYLVIPRSCAYIGDSAFLEMKSNTGDLTTICVYKDSYGHRWIKGKRVKSRVIESVDDIPKLAPKETDSDFLAAFIDTPTWAVKSQAFVAKALAMTKVNIVDHIPVVAELTPELRAFFDCQAVSNVSDTNYVGRHVERVGSNAVCPEGYVSVSALYAATLNALYGSCISLLDVSVLEQYQWSVYEGYGVCRWVGKPKVSLWKDVVGMLTIYVRDNDVLYVGCGNIALGMSSHVVGWLVPQEVFSSEVLMGPDVAGRMVLEYGYTFTDVSITVHGEAMRDEVKERMLEFIFQSMVPVRAVCSAKSGRVQAVTRAVYDVINSKLHMFTSTAKRGFYDGRFGTYQGEMSIDEFRKKFGVRSLEETCLMIAEVKIAPAAPAPLSFELEFCRTHPQFQLFGDSPQTELFIECLSKSGLVKRVAQKVFQSRISGGEKSVLADNSLLITGLAGDTYLLGITYKDKFYGFEAGFDMVYFAQETDKRVVRGGTYTNPSGGYLTVVRSEDLFAVTPVCYDYLESVTDRSTSVIRRKDVFVALDFTSGKLVLAFDNFDITLGCCSGVLFSFDSAKAARDFYTSFACKFFSPSPCYISSLVEKTVAIRQVCEEGCSDRAEVVVLSDGDAHLANSILLLGNKSRPVDAQYKAGLYLDPVLRYGRI